MKDILLINKVKLFSAIFSFFITFLFLIPTYAAENISASRIATYLSQKVLNTSTLYASKAKIAMVISNFDKSEFTLLGRTEAMSAPPMSFSADFLQYLQNRPEFELVYPRYFTRSQIDQGKGITLFNIIITLSKKGLADILKSTRPAADDKTIHIKLSGESLKKGPDSAKPVRFALFSAWGEQPVKDLAPELAKDFTVTFYKSTKIGKAAFRFTRSNEVISFMSLE